MATTEIAPANDIEEASGLAPLSLPPLPPATTAAFSGATTPAVGIAELVLLASGTAKLAKLGRIFRAVVAAGRSLIDFME
jgi:hypothetical protein